MSSLFGLLGSLGNPAAAPSGASGSVNASGAPRVGARTLDGTTATADPDPICNNDENSPYAFTRGGIATN